MAIGLMLCFDKAIAADWELVRGPAHGAPGYLQIDRATISREGTSVSFWQRAVYPQPLDIPGSPGLKSRVIVSQKIIDCSKRVETLRKVVYLSDDSSQLRLAERGPYEPDDVIPGTPAEEVLELMCNSKPISPSPGPGSSRAPSGS